MIHIPSIGTFVAFSDPTRPINGYGEVVSLRDTGYAADAVCVGIKDVDRGRKIYVYADEATLVGICRDCRLPHCECDSLAAWAGRNEE